MEFRYRGFKIVTYYMSHLQHLSHDKRKLDSKGGYYCYVYADLDSNFDTSLAYIELCIGYEVKDNSEEALRDALIRYIDNNYYSLKWTRERKALARVIQILNRAMNELDEYNSGRDLYRIFKDRLQLTDKEIFDQGFVELVPYFNRENYARYIAKELTDYATLRTETGCWFFKFSEVSRLFGVQLPFDEDMLQKIKESLDDRVVTYSDFSEGIFLALESAYCPRIDIDEEECFDDAA